MTKDEISGHHGSDIEAVKWLREVAYQLAEWNWLASDILEADVTINVNIRSEDSPVILAKLDGLAQQLQKIISKENQIMATQAEIDAALQKIDAATTQQSAVLASQGSVLQTISDEVDSLIAAAAGGTLTPAQLTKLQALADGAATIATNLSAQADFSKAIAAKGAANPVPTPVPTPTPVP